MNSVRCARLKIVTTRLLSLLFCVIFVAGCGKANQFKTTSNEPISSNVPEEAPGANPPSDSLPPVEPKPPTGTVPPAEPLPGYKPIALLWEASNLRAKLWSEFVHNLFATTLKDTLGAADDMGRFCPKYNSLSTNQKVNVWGMLVSAMSKYESNFNPTSRMKETTMGTDPVTGLPVYSEGLLQLSYQDITGWSFCRFDWNKDKYLAPNDPKKTILDPYINLECGVRILSEQVARHHKIVIDRGAYWAVIKENGKYQKIKEIAALVQTLKFCQ